MSAPKPKLSPVKSDELPTIPDAASEAILQAVAQAQMAQRGVQSMVALILATLGVSIATHDISVVDGKAVIVKR